MNRYRLYVDTSSCKTCKNIYAMAGVPSATPMHFPPAWNIEKTKSKGSNFGSNLGVPNSQLYGISAELRFDSWLTIGAHGTHSHWL